MTSKRTNESNINVDETLPEYCKIHDDFSFQLVAPGSTIVAPGW
jgi:hypothetical protein